MNKPLTWRKRGSLAGSGPSLYHGDTLVAYYEYATDRCSYLPVHKTHVSEIQRFTLSELGFDDPAREAELHSYVETLVLLG